MPRIRNILNPWGKVSRTNLQRSDLWQVDLSEVVQGIKEAFGYCPDVPPYFGASVGLPEMRVAHAPIRRDSRSYQMPGFDEPLEPVRFVFRMDDGQVGTTNYNAVGYSVIHQVLGYWRQLVRAGRGAVGKEPEIALDDNYRRDYAFPVYVYLLRGYEQPETDFTSMQLRPGTPVPPGYTSWRIGDIQALLPDVNDQAAFEASVQRVKTVVAQYSFKQALQDTLPISGIIVLENAWLSGFKLSDLNYDTSGHLTIEASICCENLFADTP